MCIFKTLLFDGLCVTKNQHTRFPIETTTQSHTISMHKIIMYSTYTHRSKIKINIFRAI